MAVKLKLVVSPELLLTSAAVNPVLPKFLTIPEIVTVAIGLLSDGGEYQTPPLLPVIVQVTAPCVCGHTP